MREKVDQAAKGDFSYKRPKLKVLPQTLTIDVNAGENVEGVILIENENGSPIRGQVNTDCLFLEFTDQVFEGVRPELSYVFRAEKLLSGETVKGTITVVTNCGVREVPFTAFVSVPAYEASSGRIRDLFHFTNLAKEHPQEAATLFRSPNFEEVFLYRDNVNVALYRGLSQGAGKGMAMEEFLIAIHKKLPVQISADKTNFLYNSCKESFTDKFIITKNNWGYGEYHITSDSEFVVPEHRIIWTDDFMGDTYSVQFLVDTDKMMPGKNYARITVSSVSQKIEITVAADKKSADHEAVSRTRREQKCLYDLAKLHVNFCLGRVSGEKYLEGLKERINTMETDGISLITQLFKVHLGIMEHNVRTVKTTLSFLDAKTDELKERTENYCAYLYLKGLWEDDDTLAAGYVSQIEKYYQKEPENWWLLWFLLYLSPVYRSEHKKYADIAKQLRYPCHSPLIFLEFVTILNEAPELLTELSTGICEALNWGIKEKHVNREVALRYCYLAGKLRIYSELVCTDLCALYEQFAEDEILLAVCRYLMNGQRTDDRAFVWYSRGVEKNLKLADLYEYYMYSVDESKQIELRDSTLIYFLYDNHLTRAKKAMLYAYVIRNRAAIGDVYRSYYKEMRDFALRELAAGHISSNLAILYEEFIREDTVDEKIAKQLPNVMFAHEVLCENSDIIGVYVTHEELKGQEYVPFQNGRAIVNIFTENYQIFLADQLDNRYALSIDYTANKLLHLDQLAYTCMEKGSDDMRLLLNLYDRVERLNQHGKEVAKIKRRTLEIAELSAYHYRKAYSSLVRYYYDNNEGELLDAALEKLDWDLVNPADRVQFMEYCSARHYFDQAMEGIWRFGYDRIDGKRLLFISSEVFAREADNEQAALVKLAAHIFHSGHFDENMLQYLCRYYSGTIYEMAQIWKYAKEFFSASAAFLSEQESQNLRSDSELTKAKPEPKDDRDDVIAEFAGRILAQVIFSEDMSPDVYEIFYDYAQNGKDRRLILAFLKFVAYHYLVHSWLLPEKMFSHFYAQVQVQENDFCLVAVLKYLSGKKELTAQEKQFAEYQIGKLYEKKMTFAFFRDFYGKISLPLHLLDECYVEYTADPAYEVRIHYMISSGYRTGEFVTETMRDIFCGIRVKEFVLFQDEILQYYISQMRPTGEVITKSASVRYHETMDSERTSSLYHMLNLMMISQEMHEEGTLLELMEEYVQVSACAKELFCLIEED